MSQQKIKYWLIGLGIILLIGFLYWRHTQLFPSTDNAYVEAHVTPIASQVSGKIETIHVSNNQWIKKGVCLFNIDSKPYEYTLQRAQAELQIAKQTVNAAAEEIKVADASITQRHAELTNIENNYRRIMPLVKSGTYSKSQGDQITSQLTVAKAAYHASQEQLQQAQAKLGQTGDSNAQIQAAKAAVAQAELDLTHTCVSAPADGIVTNFDLRTGQIIAAGQPLFQFVETTEWWVTANFKETQLARLQSGQLASVKIDMYPHKTFHGKIDSLSAGSGSVFSLLPPENASGNWVKVTQRFPIKITILDADQRYPLRIGASSQVTIDTTSKPK